MESRTAMEGFSVDLDVKKWSEQDNDLKDWRIPLTFIGGASSEAKAGTKIKVTNLRPEVVMRINDGVLAQRLHSTISQTYGLFLNRYVEIRLNGTVVEPFRIPIGESESVQPAHDAHVCAAAERATPSAFRPRVFVLTDITKNPDDDESGAQPFSALTAANSALM